MSLGNSSPGIVGYVPAYSVAIGSTVSPFVINGAAPGIAGTILTSTGVASPPTFQSPAASSITITGDSGGPLTGASFTFTGGTTGMTFAGSGSTETLGGTLVVANGGTGRATLTDHGVLLGSGTAAVDATAVGTTNTVLLGNTGADPTFGTVPNAALANSSITLSNGTNISVSGSPVSLGGSATINVAGPITPTSYTTNGILYGNSTSSLQVTAAGSLGQTFIGAGTGGVPSFSNNLPIKGPNFWCDVLAYGADPTGVADSTTAFTNAIAAIPLGGIVWIPTGTYKITSTITITTPHVRFCGQSRTDSVINWAGSASGTMFVCNQWYQGFENITLSTASNTSTAGYAIDMQDTYDYNYVWRCDFTNFWGGVRMAGHLCYIDDIQFRTFSNAAANGNWVLMTASHDRWISKVVGDNGSNLTGFAGIRIVQTASLLMRDCSLVHGTSAMSIEPTVGLTVPSIEVINTFFDTSTNGLSVSGAGTPARCKFTNCWFSSHTAAGVLFNNANIQGFTFVNCDFYGNANGINATAATDWCVMDSRFAGNTTTGIITTAAASHSFMIMGCTIGSTGVFGVNALGINIQSGTYASYRIKDNIGLENNTTKGITDSGVVANQNQKEVSNNLGATIKGGISATTAASAAINTTETVVAGGLSINGGTAVIPANSLQIGTVVRITMLGTCTSTAANISTFTLRMGTAGTTADASVATAATSVAATSGTAIGFSAVLTFTVRTIGATGTIAGSLVLSNTGITGISANNSQCIPLTATATLNTTTANYIDVTYKSAATTTTSTFQNGIVEIVRC